MGGAGQARVTRRTTPAAASGQDTGAEPRVRVGCCGFPVGRERYARVFRLVEVQQTFYQVPARALLQRWREQLPPPFEFTLKAWQLITHDATSPTYRRLREPLSRKALRQCGSFRPTDEVHRAWERTREAAHILQARVVVFQCPSSFRPTDENLRHLRLFFSRVQRDDLRLAWEPRGAWELELIRELCVELDLVHVVDPLVHPPVAGSFRYYRLHGLGGYRYRYTEADLDRLAALCGGRESVYVLFNNVHMWEDAQRFLKRLGGA